MGEWQISDLIGNDSLLINDGYRAKNAELSEEGIPFARAGNINNGFHFIGADCLPRKDLHKVGVKVSLPGDVVFTSKGTVGRFAFVRPDTPQFIYSPQLCFWRSLNSNLINSRWLFYWMCSREFYEQYIGVSDQTDMAAYVNLRDQRKMRINLPPLPEQKAIASVLSSLDDKIELLHRQNKTLEAMAETLFRQWFIEEAQQDWETVKVGNFVRTNVSSITQDSMLKTIRYLDTSSLNEGRIDGFQVLDINDIPSRARRIVKHNDVLLSTVRPNQKHFGIIKNPAEDIIVSTGFCVISCETINPHFIYIMLTTSDMTKYLHSIAEASTSAYPSLKPSDIECLEFKRPPDEKLRQFSAYADNAWDKIEYNHIQIRTLEKLRDTLLPKLMNDEVRIKYNEHEN